MRIGRNAPDGILGLAGGSSSVVERLLAKEEVASSTLVFRSRLSPLRARLSLAGLLLGAWLRRVGRCGRIRRSGPKWRNGRRGGLKHRWAQHPCRFESGLRHQSRSLVAGGQWPAALSRLAACCSPAQSHLPRTGCANRDPAPGGCVRGTSGAAAHTPLRAASATRPLP